ncbi:kinesin-like protein KIF21B isoform X3 [Strongylocentrotus purpuratus]|uniref:Kinesin motor domain-containing protein n=1 Tax=Strongylocentrotus purpuratus TaxID=7668 RepID=A0A7M7PD40_STRPU|nr:kinesin-like protein KIF21B isoform X3 [Strongylocentrotus purpuratus]
MPEKQDDTSVRVAVRIRPQLAREKIDACRVCTAVSPDEPQIILGPDRMFTYDNVFDMDSQQDSLYQKTVHDLIEGCFEGYNATVFAYGQTGSGKTYSMGTGFEPGLKEDQKGIIPRAVRHLFTGIEERRRSATERSEPPPEFKIYAEFMELYNEEVLDLFDTTRDMESSRHKKSHIKIHEDAGGGIYVVGVTTRTVTSEPETLQALQGGALSRTTASTKMNSQSSRSHAIFTLHIKQQRLIKVTTEIEGEGEKEAEKAEGDGMNEFEMLTAKFHFVDLAGSERLKRTGATGDRAKEGISINCGLLALGNVISALGDPTKRSSHVPYRDSKLTRLLQDSLGGNSRTLMIACVSPSDQDFMETLNTLRYANRARNIKNAVIANQDKTSRQLALLRTEIKRLQDELNEYKQGKRSVNSEGVEEINDLFHENTLLQMENGNLRLRIKALQETIDGLTARVALLVAEQARYGMSASTDRSCYTMPADLGGTDGDDETMTMMTGYIKEVEELRAKLVESESMNSALRRKNVDSPVRVNSRASMMNPSHGALRPSSAIFTAPIFENEHYGDEGVRVASVLSDAKKQVEADQEKIRQVEKRRDSHGGSEKDMESCEEVTDESHESVQDHETEGTKEERGEEDEEEKEEEDADDEDDDDKDSSSSSDSESDEEENAQLQENLAELACEITIKQRLIEELEHSQKRLHTMKMQYEEKLGSLLDKIKETESERDKVLDNLGKFMMLERERETERERQRQRQREREHSQKRLHTMKMQYEEKLGSLLDKIKETESERDKVLDNLGKFMMLERERETERERQRQRQREREHSQKRLHTMKMQYEEKLGSLLDKIKETESERDKVLDNLGKFMMLERERETERERQRQRQREREHSQKRLHTMKMQYEEKLGSLLDKIKETESERDKVLDNLGKFMMLERERETERERQRQRQREREHSQKRLHTMKMQYEEKLGSLLDKIKETESERDKVLDNLGKFMMLERERETERERQRQRQREREHSQKRLHTMKMQYEEKLGSLLDKIKETESERDKVLDNLGKFMMLERERETERERQRQRQREREHSQKRLHTMKMQYEEKLGSLLDKIKETESERDKVLDNLGKFMMLERERETERERQRQRQREREHSQKRLHTMKMQYEEKLGSLLDKIKETESERDKVLDNLGKFMMLERERETERERQRQRQREREHSQKRLHTMKMQYEEKLGSLLDKIKETESERDKVLDNLGKFMMLERERETERERQRQRQREREHSQKRLHTMKMQYEEKLGSLLDKIKETESERDKVLDNLGKFMMLERERETERERQRQRQREREHSQKRLHTMKMQYEEKLGSLLDKIKETESERDKVLDNLGSMAESRTKDKAEKIRKEFEIKLKKLSEEKDRLTKVQKEHNKILKSKSQFERQMKGLKDEVFKMKETKVKLMKQIREEQQKGRNKDQLSSREIQRLKKESRKKETQIKTLEASAKQRELILKRKHEQLEMLRKNQKPMSDKVAGRLSRPVKKPSTAPSTAPAETGQRVLSRRGKAKVDTGRPSKHERKGTSEYSSKTARQKWNKMERKITDIIARRQTISYMERDMERFIHHRHKLSKKVEKYLTKRDEALKAGNKDPSVQKDLDEQIDGLNDNMEYVQEQITECQSGIMEVMEGKEEIDAVDAAAVIEQCSLREAKYMLEHFINLAINKGLSAAQKESQVKELEAKLHQEEQNSFVQQTLLQHMMKEREGEDLDLDGLFSNPNLDSESSSNSSRAPSPVDISALNALAVNVPDHTTLPHIGPANSVSAIPIPSQTKAKDKARRRTATSEELLGFKGTADFTPDPAVGVVIESDETSSSTDTASVDSSLVFPSSHIPIRKDGRLEKLSPALRRKNITQLQALSNPSSVDHTPDHTPPGSPPPSRTGNVFSRLAQTNSPAQSQKDRGSIIPVINKPTTPRAPLVCSYTAEGHSKAVLSVQATEELLFSGSKDRSVKIWKLDTGKEIATLAGHTNNVGVVRYCEKLKLVFSVSTAFIRIWDIRDTQKCVTTLSSSGMQLDKTAGSSSSRTVTLPQGETQINDIAINESGTRLYSAAGNIVRVWDLSSFQSMCKLFGGPSAAVMCLDVKTTPQFDQVFAGSKDHYVKMFEVEPGASGCLTSSFNFDPPHYDGIQSMAIRGNSLFSGSRDACIKKWDLDQKQLSKAMSNAHKDWICALDFLPSYNCLLSGCRGGYLKLWNIDTCTPVGEMKAHTSPINSIATNSTHVFTASSDEIKLWRKSESTRLPSL